MSHQFALDIVNDETAAPPMTEVGLAESILRSHDGDALEAIRSLLADTDFLRDQLWIASNLMSKGIARGWKPKYERLG